MKQRKKGGVKSPQFVVYRNDKGRFISKKEFNKRIDKFEYASSNIVRGKKFEKLNIFNKQRKLNVKKEIKKVESISNEFIKAENEIRKYIKKKKAKKYVLTVTLKTGRYKWHINKIFNNIYSKQSLEYILIRVAEYFKKYQNKKSKFIKVTSHNIE